MQSPIKIQKDGKHINVYFSYNEDLVRIMNENNGWWSRKGKCWMFPLYKRSDIAEVLRANLYTVNYIEDRRR